MTRDELTARIDEAHDGLGCRLGWLLLACPWINVVGADVALITLNPGGFRPEPNRLSYEVGSTYVHETWLGRERPDAPLQIQIQHLFKIALAEADDVLAGYLVPFRSPTWDELPRPSEALEFGVGLWRELLGSRRPRLTFTISNIVFREMRAMFAGGPVTLSQSGWGNARIRVSDYDGGRLIGLPHLSRYRLFGVPKRDEIVRHLIAGGLPGSPKTDAWIL